ncbi:hypothetical protein [Floridanema evergladense]|uniref:Ribbon-helix-helix protein CopG domain-containing protein n=1 Tax=Floridaenema evergladense BLCC-F167 TaxID=3153639 RepID=A0ABV4WGC2_9CYAN
MSTQQQRDVNGKFTSKSLEYREVRSIRLTDKVWEALGNIAQERSITRADLIEELVERGVFDVLAQPPNEEMILANQCQRNEIDQLEEKINELDRTISYLYSELALELNDAKDATLYSFKKTQSIGEQSARYKDVKKALDSFIKRISSFINSKRS